MKYNMESNRSSLVKLIDNPTSVEKFITQLGKSVPGGTSINVTVNLLGDGSGMLYPIENKFEMPASFVMFFKEVKRFMFHMQNGLSVIDLFVYFELASKFASDKQFTTSSTLWKEIETESILMGREYRTSSIRKSFYKIVKSQLIIKVSPERSVYVINKVLAFQGNLNTRADVVKDDFHRATMTDAKNNNTKI